MLLLKQFAAMYDDDIDTNILDGMGEIPQVWEEYFNKEQTRKYITSTTGYSGMGSAPKWADGAALPLDEPRKIYDNTITQEFYGFGFKASRKLLQYGDVGTILGWATALGRGLANTYGEVHADVLNNAFTTTWASLGTVALISASHGSMGSATRSNINASAALSPATLEVLIVQGLNHENYRGQKDPIRYNKLITVPALRRTATKILESVGETGTGNNDINTQLKMFKLLIDSFLEDSTTHYFLQAAKHGMRSLHGLLPTKD